MPLVLMLIGVFHLATSVHVASTMWYGLFPAPGNHDFLVIRNNKENDLARSTYFANIAR